MSIFSGVFVILHGLVHFWYVTLSRGWVEFQPEMGWSGQSWLLASVLSAKVSGLVAVVLYSLAGIALAVGGVGLIAQADWAKQVLIGSAGLSTATIFIFWDGNPEFLVQKGLLGLLINLVILGAALLGNS